MARKEVSLHGQQIGRFHASWLLFKESFRFLRADSEMVWIPFIMTIINLILFGLLVLSFILFVPGTMLTEGGFEDSTFNYIFIFLCYVIGAFTLALSEAGITHIVYTRAHGGDATLGEGLGTAFSHWLSLLLWSLITSTVGIVLRMIAERSKLLGKIVVLIVGVAWSVLTYFVVPAMIIDKKSAFGSIGKSGQVFRETWGETIVTNISIGLIFFVAHMVAMASVVGLVIFAIATDIYVLALVTLGLYILWIILASLVQSALSGVIKTLLYIYASEGEVPQSFDRELLENVLFRDPKMPSNRDSITQDSMQHSPSQGQTIV